MTPEQLNAIQARADAAQWTLTPSSQPSICEAIADIPALLDEVRRLQGQVEALVKLVREAYQAGCSDAADYECGYGGGFKHKEILSDLNAIMNGAESEGG